MDLNFDEHENMSLKRFEKMLRTDSVYFFDSSEFDRIIKYYIDNGKTNLAKKAISLGLLQHPASIGLRLLKAELFIIEEKFSEALQLLDEVEAVEPTNEEVYIQKAMLLSKKEMHNEAIDLLMIAKDLTEDSNIDVLSLIGMEYLFLEDFERALMYFKYCLDIDSLDATSLYNVVYCFDILDQQDKAINFLNNYIEKEPFSETAWHQLGRQYASIEEFVKALEAFDYALIIDEQFIGAYIEKAKILEELGRYQEAIENYLLTTELDDPTAFAYYRIGKNFEKLNNTKSASEYFLMSNEQDPFLDKPLLALASLNYNIEEYQKAIFYIHKLIEINDENIDYWKIYAQSNLRISFFEEAAKAFRKSIELGDSTLEVFTSLADTLYYIGDYKDAIKELLKAEIFFHKQAEIEYRLSGLYFLIRNNALGKKHLISALEINTSKYKLFKSLFPVVHNSKLVKVIVTNYKYPS